MGHHFCLNLINKDGNQNNGRKQKDLRINTINYTVKEHPQHLVYELYKCIYHVFKYLNLNFFFRIKI